MADHDNLETRIPKSIGYVTWIIVFVLLFFDQLTKYIVVQNIPLHKSYPVIENFFDITHIRNTGIAFGLFSNDPSKLKSIIMCVITFLSLIFIIFLLFKIRNSSRFFSIGLSSILAGAFGNLIDRVFRDGSVVDFLDVHWYNLHWPAFNVADSSITIGVGLLFIDTIFTKEKKTDKSNSP